MYTTQIKEILHFVFFCVCVSHGNQGLTKSSGSSKGNKQRVSKGTGEQRSPKVQRWPLRTTRLGREYTNIPYSFPSTGDDLPGFSSLIVSFTSFVDPCTVAEIQK